MYKNKYVNVIAKFFAVIVGLRLLLVPFLGNPVSKFLYYFDVKEYVENKYSFDIELGMVRYSTKEGTYYINAESPEYPGIDFRIKLNKDSGEISDNLVCMKWCDDSRLLLKSYVVSKYTRADINFGLTRFSESDFIGTQKPIEKIPNFLEVEKNGEYISNVVIWTNSDYGYTHLDNAFTIYQTARKFFKNVSVTIKYNGTSFYVPHTRVARNRTEFSKFGS